MRQQRQFSHPAHDRPAPDERGEYGDEWTNGAGEPSRRAWQEREPDGYRSGRDWNGGGGPRGEFRREGQRVDPRSMRPWDARSGAPGGFSESSWRDETPAREYEREWHPDDGHGSADRGWSDGGVRGVRRGDMVRGAMESGWDDDLNRAESRGGRERNSSFRRDDTPSWAMEPRSGSERGLDRGWSPGQGRERDSAWSGGRARGWSGHSSEGDESHFVGGSPAESWRNFDPNDGASGAGRSGYGGRGTSSRDAWGGARERGKSPRGYQRADERIREEIAECIIDCPELDASDVQIDVAAGEVTLSGTVCHRGAKYRIEEIADRISGVKEIENQIKVKRRDESDAGDSKAGEAVGAGASSGASASRGSSQGRGSSESDWKSSGRSKS